MTGTAPRIRASLAILVVTAILSIAGCGSATPAASTAPAASSAPLGSSPASSSGSSGGAAGSGHENSGGVADTPSNPDRTYICAAVANDSAGAPIGYVTVAGSDPAGAQAECAALPAGSGWSAAATSPYHENLYTPVCFITFDGGQLTARVYTSDSATFAQGVSLCNPILTQFAVPTLPPS